MAKKHFIKDATKNKGALHRHLGVKEGEKIPEDKLRAATHSKDPTVRKEADLAVTLKGLNHGDKDKKKHRTGKEIRNKLYGSKE
jgi:hypothetical protein